MVNITKSTTAIIVIYLLSLIVSYPVFSATAGGYQTSSDVQGQTFAYDRIIDHNISVFYPGILQDSTCLDYLAFHQNVYGLAKGMLENRDDLSVINKYIVGRYRHFSSRILSIIPPPFHSDPYDYADIHGSIVKMFEAIYLYALLNDCLDQSSGISCTQASADLSALQRQYSEIEQLLNEATREREFLSKILARGSWLIKYNVLTDSSIKAPFLDQDHHSLINRINDESQLAMNVIFDECRYDATNMSMLPPDVTMSRGEIIAKARSKNNAAKTQCEQQDIKIALQKKDIEKQKQTIKGKEEIIKSRNSLIEKQDQLILHMEAKIAGLQKEKGANNE